MSESSHADLVRIAAKHLWTTRHCWMVLTERVAQGESVIVDGRMMPGGQSPDAIGWWWEGSILIECKRSRSDFLAERKKVHRNGHLGMGSERWYFAPKGVIAPEDLTDGWGLMILRGDRVLRVVQAEKRPEWDMDAETKLLSGEAREWLMAARSTDTELPTRKWEDKYRIMRVASRSFRNGWKCPKCDEWMT